MGEGDARMRDEYGRAFFAPNEVPDEPFAHWKGRLTHPSAVHTPWSEYPAHSLAGHERAL